MILEQTTIVLRISIVERTLEDIAKHTANIPGSCELCTDGEILIRKSEIQTCDILRVISIAKVATLVIRINIAITVEVHIDCVARIELGYQLFGER